MMNGACVAQILTVTDRIQQTQYSQLEMLVNKGHNRPLLACGRVLLDTDYLANLVHPAAADLVDHAA